MLGVDEGPTERTNGGGIVGGMSADRFGSDDARWLRVYRRLRSRARHLMAAERVGHTLDPTGLVHEMLLRVSRDRRAPRSPEEFLAAGAVVMRRILVESARRRGRVKRGGHLARLDIAPDSIVDGGCTERIVAVDRALARLDAVDPEAAHVAVLRRLLDAAPRPEVMGRLPAGLAVLIGDLLQADPQRRPPSAGAVAARLGTLGAG